MTPAAVVVLGFGGHARSVADVALAAGVSELRFVDALGRLGESFHGFPVTTKIGAPLSSDWLLFPASGDNATRERQMQDFEGDGRFCTLVSPRAYVGVDATLGRAVFVAHHAHVGPETVVGDGCIVNTGAVVDHECRIGRFAHVSINATVAGRCRIGERVFLGAGAVVIDGVEIADDIVVGAGAVVIENLHNTGVYVGVPARRVER